MANKPDEYTIEVTMKPHPWDNKHEPYFWCIVGSYDGIRCNEGYGWSKTTEQAWIDANIYHKMYHLL